MGGGDAWVPPQIGTLWENYRGRYAGRRGRVVSVDTHVVVSPEPGSCPCPAKQRTTRIRFDEFLKSWLEVVEQIPDRFRCINCGKYTAIGDECSHCGRVMVKPEAFRSGRR